MSAAVHALPRRAAPASSVDLAHRAAAGEFDAAVCAWIAAGMVHHLAGQPLDQALRLDRASRVRQRDRHIRAAAEALAPGASPWRRAVLLEKAAHRFTNRVLPFLADGRAVGDIDTRLAAAHRCGIPLPTTARALYMLLRD